MAVEGRRRFRRLHRAFIPLFIWFLLWLAATVAAVALGGSWLVIRT